MPGSGVLLGEGRLHTVAALGLGGATAGGIGVASPSPVEIAGQLAIVGIALFAFALAIGSAHLVGLATFPMLGGAVIASAAAGDTAWVRSIVLGCLWYVAVEVAWEGIERRDGIGRQRAFDNRRTNEVATVVTFSLAMTTAGLVLSSQAPARSGLAMGTVIFGLLGAIVWMTRRLRDQYSREQPAASGEPNLQVDSGHD